MEAQLFTQPLALPMPTPPQSAPSVFAGRAWQQVLARDPSADGQFVYAVKSTGIYCRPSCPSRRPERKNVSFFPTPALAEAAGFRACLRCEPLRTEPKPDIQAEAIRRAANYLSEHAAERTKLDDLAAAAGLGKFALQRGFKRVLGVTPGEFAREQRKERFRTRVRSPRPTSKSPVTDAVYEAGYGSPSRLYEGVAATLGMSPTAMKSGGAGEIIHYATAASPLGRILVATTARGLCAVLFADTDAEATIALRDQFPQAALRPSTPSSQPTDLSPQPAANLSSRPEAALFAAAVERPAVNNLDTALTFVLSSLTETPTAATLPFHVRATAFQQRVWQALLAIPRGQTRTYAQIAETIGSPSSVRAVGTACGANPLALVVPCHRVVGADGRLTGYHWGIDRKRRLLELERAEARN